MLPWKDAVEQKILKINWGSFRVRDVSDMVGLSRVDGRNVANYLAELNWVKLTENGLMTITPLGYEEIAKLKRPAWRRWIDRHPVTMNAFWTTTTGIVAGVVYTVITYYLLRPQ